MARQHSEREICHQDKPHILWDPVQNENVGLPAQKLRISTEQQWGLSQCEAHTGHTPLKLAMYTIR